jgi:hypothetical protein
MCGYGNTEGFDIQLLEILGDAYYSINYSCGNKLKFIDEYCKLYALRRRK